MPTLAQEGVESGHAHDGGVDDLTLKDCEAVLEHGGRAVGGDVLDREAVVAGEDDDCSLERKSSTPMVATLVLLSELQAPIEWGWLRA